MRVLRVAGNSKGEACDHRWSKVEGTQRPGHLQRKGWKCWHQSRGSDRHSRSAAVGMTSVLETLGRNSLAPSPFHLPPCEDSKKILAVSQEEGPHPTMLAS